MTTLAALAKEMPTYDPKPVHLSRVGIGDLTTVCAGWSR